MFLCLAAVESEDGEKPREPALPRASKHRLHMSVKTFLVPYWTEWTTRVGLGFLVRFHVCSYKDRSYFTHLVSTPPPASSLLSAPPCRHLLLLFSSLSSFLSPVSYSSPLVDRGCNQLRPADSAASHPRTNIYLSLKTHFNYTPP